MVHHRGQLTGELPGKLAGAPLPKHAPSLTKGFLRPFQEVLGNPLPCPQPVLSYRTNTHTSPPPHLQSSQHFLQLTASLLFPLGSCYCGHRQLTSLWEPGPVITCGPLGLLLGLAVSLGVCRTSYRPSYRPGIRLVTSESKRPRLLFSWLLLEPPCWSQLNREGLG